MNRRQTNPGGTPSSGLDLMRLRILVLLFASILVPLAHSFAQQQTPETPQPEAPEVGVPDPPTFFPHPTDSRFWISGQVNVIFQAHPSFPAQYSGPNSQTAKYDKATSRVETLYTGIKLNDTTELLFDLEETNGRGIGYAFGLAGFTNLDVVRNPDLGSAPYVARLMFHKVFPLSSDTVEVERGPLALFTELPRRRLEFRIGKFSMVDFFDVNSAGSDSHLQFMNWTVDDNGAYDYAADTRGYTWGAVLDFEDGSWGIRFGETLMPKVANGLDEQWNLHRAHASNVELECRKGLVPYREGVVRLLGFDNIANMGIYRVAIDNFVAGTTPLPEITAHPLQTTRKYGFGLDVDQALAGPLHAFARLGWNNGKTESFAYTEVDQTVEAGVAMAGTGWRRKFDRAGVALVSNGISRDHQNYLRLGGIGFLLGDGTLNYGRETIEEAFYDAHLWRGIFGSFDLQHINNPGYNRDRGPIIVPAVRLHLEF